MMGAGLHARRRGFGVSPGLMLPTRDCVVLPQRWFTASSGFSCPLSHSHHLSQGEGSQPTPATPSWLFQLLELRERSFSL